VVSTPEVSGDLLFIGSCAGVFYALDRHTGEVRWSQDLGKVGFHGNPIIIDNVVIVGTDINGQASGVGYVYAFEVANGKQRWKAAANRGVASDLILAGSSIYGVTLSDELIAIDFNSGRVNWIFAPRPDKDDRLPSSPAVSGDAVFFGERDGGVYSIQARTGAVIWKQQLATPVSTSLIAFDQSVYFGAANHIYRVSQKTGVTETHFLAGGWCFGKPLITGNSMLIFVGEELTSLDLSLKNQLWHQKANGKWRSPRPLIWGKAVLAGNELGEVYAFQTTDGARQWMHRFEGIIRSIGSSGPILFVGTKQGTVYAYTPMQKAEP
jgi:outer membrane protein assembly factor BamB